MTSTSTPQPSPLPPDAHPARQTLAVAITPMSRHRPQGLASSHKTKIQASSFFLGCCMVGAYPRDKEKTLRLERPSTDLVSGDSSQDRQNPDLPPISLPHSSNID